MSMLNNYRKMFRLRTRSLFALLLVISAVGSPVLSWQQSDRQAYNNKMALLKVMLEGARQRAVEKMIFRHFVW